MNEEKEGLLKERKTLSEESTGLKQQNYTFKKDFTELNQDFEKAKKDLNKKLEDLAADKLALEDKNKAIIQELASAEQSKKTLEADIKKVKNANSILQSKTKELFGKKQESEKAGIELSRKAETLAKTLHDVSKERAQLQKKRDALSDKNLALKKERGTLKMDLSRARREKRREKAKVKRVSSKLSLRGKEFMQLLDNRNDLKNKLYKLNKEYNKLDDKNIKLAKQLIPTSALKRKLALAYQQLGTVYTKVGLFDLAIEAYNTSLYYDKGYAIVYYHLGLLYHHAKKDTQKSIYHFQKYLQLNPEAEDREEVAYLINMLMETQRPDLKPNVYYESNEYKDDYMKSRK